MRVTVKSRKRIGWPRKPSAHKDQQIGEWQTLDCFQSSMMQVENYRLK